ncbi:unnamed protein product [Nippostrongylus brasiliensis]|uniref:Uncharacterized protein n=1 Tax=Nippostrongylus brasiliensis TaxID=27835 RepID=A0A0N4YRV2_NIPBR|nr:unnamed protein product [Nippostrongylus brasiliensis]
MRRVQLVSHRILRFRRFCSTLPPANVDDINLKSYLPSEDFLKQYVRRPSHRDKLTTLLSEVQTFLEMFGKDSLPEFDDSLWRTYFGTWSADDRCQLLNELRLERKNDERLADKPEKVQASEQIQSLHDSNWTSRLPFNISIVNFRPDNHLAEIAKRQIQSLHDSNWTSRLPFNISIVNFRPDNHLAEIAKSS